MLACSGMGCWLGPDSPVTEAAEFLGIKKSTLYEWIVQKKVPHYKVGRLVKFKREDLEAWLKENGQDVKKSFN